MKTSYISQLKNITKLFLVIGLILVGTHAVAQETPEALIKRVSAEVIEAARADKDIQAGNQQKAVALMQDKILLHVDYSRMTGLTTGSYWRHVTPNQQMELVNEFRLMLLHTYGGFLTHIKDQKVEVKLSRAGSSDTEVEVSSKVIQPKGDPIMLGYRLEKMFTGWKIYDFNINGVWMIQNYKTTFYPELSHNGINGLIKYLAEKNKSMAARR